MRKSKIHRRSWESQTDGERDLSLVLKSGRIWNTDVKALENQFIFKQTKKKQNRDYPDLS